MARTAIILSVGDELLLGQSLDTNAPWLADQLTEMGLLTIERRTVGDDRLRHGRAIRDAIGTTAAQGADVLIMTGGLGPTQDDLTRFALGDVVAHGCELEADPVALQLLEARFAQRQLTMPASNRVQVLKPVGATLLPNPNGTAPGLLVEHEGTLIVALPGPPREMKPMFEASVRPRLEASGKDQPLVTASVNAFGQGESRAAEAIADLMVRGGDPEVGLTVSGGVLTARIRSRDAARVSRAAEAVARSWGALAYSRGYDSLASVVLDELRAANQTLATAESCTGGEVGRSIVSIPGASAVYVGGWIAYANAAKIRDLGVIEEQLRGHGAVSGEVARAMATGARIRSGADWAISTTGIAGPEGGTPEKPVGTVCIGLARGADSTGPGETTVHAFRFPGDRGMIRDLAGLAALQLLRWALQGRGADAAELDWRSAPPERWPVSESESDESQSWSGPEPLR